MRRLPWFTARDHMRRRKPWSFVFVDELPKGHENDGGLTDSARREVLILATLAWPRILEVLAHEIGHALTAYRRTETALEAAADEQFATWIEPSLLPFMASMGAQIPPLPEGFSAFRRAARAKR